MLAESVYFAYGDVGISERLRPYFLARGIAHGAVERRGGDDLFGGIHGLDRRGECLRIGVDELGQTRQEYDRRAPLLPCGAVDISLFAPEYIEYAFEGRALAAIVVERQELEARISGRAQVAFDFVFIAQGL